MSLVDAIFVVLKDGQQWPFAIVIRDLVDTRPDPWFIEVAQFSVDVPATHDYFHAT